MASKVGAWLDIEVAAPQNEARTYVSRETLYHDLFRKSVRAVRAEAECLCILCTKPELDD